MGRGKPTGIVPFLSCTRWFTRVRLQLKNQGHLVHRTAMLATLFLLSLTGLVLGMAPELDLRAAQAFFRDGRFIGITPTGELLRSVGHGLPFVIMGLAFTAYFLRKTGLIRLAGPQGRSVVFLALTLALGPGLLVNSVLKDNSHRPRPVQTQDMGGSWEFRPWYRFDGDCIRNCSFVSGEASSAFWTLAPALLTPSPLQPLAIGAALTFGTGVALLRMAFGGHYLSDSLMSALMTILLVLAFHRWMIGGQAKTRPPAASASDPDLRRNDTPL